MKCALTYRLLCDCCKLIVETPFCIYVTEHFAQHALQHLAFTCKTNHPLLILLTDCRNLCCQYVYVFFLQGCRSVSCSSILKILIKFSFFSLRPFFSLRGEELEGRDLALAPFNSFLINSSVPLTYGSS